MLQPSSGHSMSQHLSCAHCMDVWPQEDTEESSADAASSQRSLQLFSRTTPSIWLGCYGCA